MQRKTIQTIVGLLACGLVIAVPLAGAFSVGIDRDGVDALQASGVQPTYGQVWVGRWVKNDWSSFENDLRELRDEGVTPVVLWYYWGDGISINAVKYGKDGKSRYEWDSMSKELGRRGNAVMNGKTWLVVLEPEFNKNGIQDWDTFDGYLATQSANIKNNAPSAKTVIGFGHWGGWSIFDRAVGAANYAGLQMMRASTRDSTYRAEHAADDILTATKSLKSKFGKSVIMYDLAIGTYGGWEGVQERSIKRFVELEGALDAAGMIGLVYRDIEDNDHSSGYFGAAESSWGLKFRWGTAKRAYDDFIQLARGSTTSVSTTTTTTSTSTSVSSTSFDAKFSDVSIDNWWTQVDVDANEPIASVKARVNGGSWISLSKKSWGDWAGSFRVPDGAKVEFQATSTDGSKDLSSAYYE